MDKKLVSNKIILMRKTATLAKHRVRQKILKSISALKKKIAKSADANGNDNNNYLTQLKNKLQSKQEFVVNLKSLDKDLISKEALARDLAHFNSLISKTPISSKEHVLAVVCTSKTIQQEVQKFKEENPESEQWLPELIELWGKKKKKKNKGSTAEGRDVKPTSAKSPTKPQSKTLSVSVSPKKASLDIHSTGTTPKSTVAKKTVKRLSPAAQFTVTPMEPKVEPKIEATGAAVIKRLDLSKLSTTISKVIDSDTSSSEGGSSSDQRSSVPQPASSSAEASSEKKTKDAFFFRQNGDEPSSDGGEDESDEETGEAEGEKKSPRSNDIDKKKFGGQANSGHKFKFNGQKNFGGQKGNFGENKSNFGGNKNFAGTKKPFDGQKGGPQKPFNRGAFDRTNTQAKPFGKNFQSPAGAPKAFPIRGGILRRDTPRPSSIGKGGGNLHPSWQAKQAEKGKVQHLSFSGTGINKKIKFD